MTKTQLNKQIAHLESINDQLFAEICYVDRLMRQVGFENGLETVKATALEIYETDVEEEFNDEEAV